MRYILSVVAVLLLSFAPAVAAQTGTLTGKVIEPATRAPVPGATVSVVGGQAEAITDSSGSYQLQLEPGTYTLRIEAGTDYETKTVEGVQVSANQTASREITLARGGGSGKKAAEFGEYTVSSGFLEGTTGSVLAEEQQSLAVTEVIGAGQIARAGDANAAEALTRVSGLTVDQGKYTQIRGQPARYSSTLFNGSPLPSADPIRQSTPLDLFPTGLLSSISVRKAYSADLPGSFGSGLVTLRSKDIPQEDFAKASVSTGGNTESTGETGQDYQGGETDYLGEDDGTRALPGPIASAPDSGPNALRNRTQAERNQIGKSFSDSLGTSDKTLPPDIGLSASGGEKFETESGDYGLLGSVSWGNDWRKEEELDRLIAAGGNVEREFNEERTNFNAGLSTLLVAGADWGAHKLTSNTFFIRDSQQTTEIAQGFNATSDTRTVKRFTLRWKERELALQQLTGSHDFDFLKVDWRGQIAEATRETPDRRTYALVQQPGGGGFEVFDEQGLTRRFNKTEDDISSFGVDLTLPVIESETLKLNARSGISSYSQDRKSETNTFLFRPRGNANLDAPPEQVYDPDNLGDTLDLIDTTQGSGSYEADASVNAAYLSVDATWPEVLRVVAGIRQETADYDVVTQKFVGGRAEAIRSGFEQTEVLPSLNLTYMFAESMQIKAGFSSTVSRPRLVELSDTTFFDPDDGDRFQGNPNLEPATIDSVDLRWEWFPSNNETLSVGTFAKEYTNPIELNFIPISGGGFEREYINAESAEVYGLELGGRTAGLGWIPDAINWLDWRADAYIKGNLAILDSEVTVDPATNATNPSRPLQGQADSIANLQLGFIGASHEWAVSINRVGEQLSEAGARGAEDVVREPVTKLDASWSYNWTKSGTLKVTGKNLTNPEVEFTQGDKTEGRRREGATLELKYTYEF